MQTIISGVNRDTRMRPLTDDRPKSLLPVAGKPLIRCVIDTAVAAGATTIVLVIRDDAGAVHDYLSAASIGVPFAIVKLESQHNPIDVIRAAAPKLDREPFAVLNGDSLYDVPSLSELFENVPAVGTFRLSDSTSDSNSDRTAGHTTDTATQCDERMSERVDIGAYVFSTDIFDWLDATGESSSKHGFLEIAKRTADEQNLTRIPFDNWLEVSRPWELLEANEWKLAEIESQIQGSVSRRAELNDPVAVNDGASVRSGVVIDGPVYISSGAVVGPNAYIRGPSFIGPGAKIGHSVEVKNSIVMADVSLGHLSYLGDSILGCRTNFGAGTNVANLRHDDDEVRLTVNGERISTGRRKFGVVCGHDVKTGVNTAINAGVTLSSESMCGPGETILRDK